MAKAKMKNKSEHYISIDLDTRYMSTYHFVGYNELSNVANMLWGKGWIAEDDLSQIQELLDHVHKDKYTVHLIAGLRDDYDIEVRLNEAWGLEKEIEERDKVIDILFKYVDKKHHEEIKKKLDEMGWYNKEGNDSIR